MTAQIIAFPKVNKRTGQSPTLAELTKVKREPLSEKMKVMLKNFGGIRV